VTYQTDDELLIDYWAKTEWLRRNPTGMGAQVTPREIKEIKRKLENQGVDIEAETSRTRLGLSARWVALTPKDRQPGRVTHADPHRPHLAALPPDDVRAATDGEIGRPGSCLTCG
jgi:hypothetical protein